MNKILRALAALLAALLILTAFGLAEEDDPIVYDPDEEVGFEDSIDAHLIEEREKVSQMRNLLLIGIDARPGEETGRSDSMIIVTLDPEDNTIKLTSIMRDLYVEIPGYKNNRINAAYVFGGPELLMKTIEANFGVHIESYIAVNFSMLGTLIDAIGGLSLTVESNYYKDRINAVIREDNKVLGIDKSHGLLNGTGEQLMTGKQAQAYARYRYGTKDGDFGRTARQREVITKIFEKLSEMTALQLMRLVIDNASNVYTNLSVSDLAAFAPVLISMKDAGISELRLPVEGGFSNNTVAGMAVIVPNRKKNVSALMEFLGE